MHRALGLLRMASEWMLPPRIGDLLLGRGPGRDAPRRVLDPGTRSILARNAPLRASYSGRRCFIVGTGPSLNSQDLLPLKDELVLALNSFYLHRDATRIRPRFHVISGLALHPHMGDKGVQWLREIEERVGESTLFLNIEDRDVVAREGLFGECNVHYLCFRGDWNNLPAAGLDASGLLYPFQSVSVMALQVALYLGFGPIYLLGLDHDWVIRKAERSATHFYDMEDSVLLNGTRNEWDECRDDWEREFWSNWSLWHQYKVLKAVADREGLVIRNATAGGILDVFPRVQYETLVRGVAGPGLTSTAEEQADPS